LRPILSSTQADALAFDRAFDAFFFPVPESGGDDPRPSATPEETGINHNRQARAGRGREEASPALDDGASEAAGPRSAAIAESDVRAAACLARTSSYSPLASASPGAVELPRVDRAWRDAARAWVRRIQVGLSRRWQPSPRGPRFDFRRTWRASLQT